MSKRLEDMTEPELADLMRTLAGGLEFMCEHGGVEKPLFVLVLFNDPKIAQYISNAGDRKQMIAAMRETANRLEQREDVPR